MRKGYTLIKDFAKASETVRKGAAYVYVDDTTVLERKPFLGHAGYYADDKAVMINMYDFNTGFVTMMVQARTSGSGYENLNSTGMPVPFAQVHKQALCDAREALVAMDGTPLSLDEILGEPEGGLKKGVTLGRNGPG